MKEIDYRFIGACGLYCGECYIYLAFKNNEHQLKEEIVKAHNYVLNVQTSLARCLINFIKRAIRRQGKTFPG